jgi:hypothetical protein
LCRIGTVGLTPGFDAGIAGTIDQTRIDGCCRGVFLALDQIKKLHVCLLGEKGAVLNIIQTPMILPSIVTHFIDMYDMGLDWAD